MKPSRVLLSALVAPLFGCDLFVPPAVLCDEIVAGGHSTLVPARAGLACSTPEALLFTISHAPRVDSKRSKGSDLMLPGSPVTVTQGSASVGLCGALGPCASWVPSLRTSVGENGTITYQVALNLEDVGELRPGAKFEFKATLATETYGPGNACPIAADVSVSCTTPQDTQE